MPIYGDMSNHNHHTVTIQLPCSNTSKCFIYAVYISIYVLLTDEYHIV